MKETERGKEKVKRYEEKGKRNSNISRMKKEILRARMRDKGKTGESKMKKR